MWKTKWMLLISLGLLLSIPICSSAQTSSRHSSRKAPKPAVLPPMPSGPLPQLPMDQMPATAPQVSYQNGMLSITAQNAPLGDILREIRKQTGASIDVPPNANERVVTRLGPAPAREVLANLLNGTSFNYVMVGSAADPNALASVMLTPKPIGGAESPQTAAVYQPPMNQSQFPQPPNMYQGPAQRVPGAMVGQPAPQNPQVNNGDDSSDDSDDSADDNSDDQDNGQPDVNGAAPQAAPQPNAGPKTPEQILDMLRRNQQPGQPPVPPTAAPDQQ